MDTTDIRKIKPYLRKTIVKGYTYYRLVRKDRIDGKVKRVWSKHLGTAAVIERVYDERDNLIPNLKIRSFEYGRTAALIQNLLVATKNRWRSLHFCVTFKLKMYSQLESSYWWHWQCPPVRRRRPTLRKGRLW